MKRRQLDPAVAVRGPHEGYVRSKLAGVDSWSIRHVRREHNAEADRLVNEALDAA